MSTAWVDGAFVEGAAIAAADGSFARGEGLFETMRAEGGQLPLWERHLRRLALSAKVLEIRCVPPLDLHGAALELLERTGRRDGVLRLTLSHGVEEPSWVMTSRGREELDRPLELVASHARRGPADPSAAHKTTSRAFYRLALRDAREAAVDDVLLLGRGDEVLETAYANVFCVVDGKLVTPPLDGRVLPGIGREVVAEHFADRLVEASIAMHQLEAGFWVSNAVYGPRPACIRGHGAAVDAGWGSRLRAAWAGAIDGSADFS